MAALKGKAVVKKCNEYGKLKLTQDFRSLQNEKLVSGLLPVQSVSLQLI